MGQAGVGESGKVAEIVTGGGGVVRMEQTWCGCKRGRLAVGTGWNGRYGEKACIDIAGDGWVPAEGGVSG